jgi:hypothetical protein
MQCDVLYYVPVKDAFLPRQQIFSASQVDARASFLPVQPGADYYQKRWQADLMPEFLYFAQFP